MIKTRVLFVCIHNSARSQMAEAFLNSIGGEFFEAESAGFEPGNLNPYVLDAMKEIGYDLSANKTKEVFELYRQGRIYTYVVTVCDEGNAEKCPVFPGMMNRLHWSFSDPSGFSGSPAEIMEKTRKVRDAVKAKIEEFIAQVR
jgi:arsenate reductase